MGRWGRPRERSTVERPLRPRDWGLGGCRRWHVPQADVGTCRVGYEPLDIQACSQRRDVGAGPRAIPQSILFQDLFVRLYSYVVARDYGFAPNPFFGVCTLATCKPEIRRLANVGDWIVGTGASAQSGRDVVVYIMRVTETMTFNEYWTNARFRQKRPNLRGSKKQAFGDNIYFRDKAGRWHQRNSHHSYADGSPNSRNLAHDTRVDGILFSDDFAYWGRSGPRIPARFRGCAGVDIRAGRGYRSIFPATVVDDFVTWYRGLGECGYRASPWEWR